MNFSESRGEFWSFIWQNQNKHLVDRTLSLNYVALDFHAEMRIIKRTKEELFETTVARDGARAKVVVNGNFYDVSRIGLSDAAWGDDPVAARHTSVEGRLISKGTKIGGSSEPNLFYIAQVPATMAGHTYAYTSGFGDPPMGDKAKVNAAIGGAGPLIIDGLKHGKDNLYKVNVPSTARAPKSGKPGPVAQRYLAQRNNATFISAESKPVGTGKTILAAASMFSCVLVGVQAHGAAPGASYTKIRDSLADQGFDHAIFLDGSDSSLMMVNGQWVVEAASNKNETNVVGVAFF